MDTNTPPIEEQEQITDVALTKQDDSTVKILQEDDLKTLKDAVEEIKAFKRKYTLKKLTITDLDSKDQKENLRLALQTLRTKRTSLKSDKSEKTAPYRETVAYINSNYDKVIGAIEAIEEPLIAHNKKIKADIEEKELAEENGKKQRVNDRVAKLLDAGITFNDNFYEIGSEEFSVPAISLGIIDLETMTDGIFENVLAQVVEKNAIITEAQVKKDAEELRLKLEKEQKEKEEKEKFEADQKKLADEQKALDEEKAEMRKNRIETRGEQLIGLGLVFLEKENEYMYMPERISVDLASMGNMPSLDWNKMILELKTTIEESKKLAAEREEEKKKNDLLFAQKKLRESELQDLGFEFTIGTNAFHFGDIKIESGEIMLYQTDVEWNEMIQRVKPAIEEIIADRKKKAEEKKIADDKTIADKAIADKKLKDDQDESNRKAELEKQGDKAVYEDFISRLKAVAWPECKSQEYINKISGIRTYIESLK